MSGTIHLLPLYAIMACTETTSPQPFDVNSQEEPKKTSEGCHNSQPPDQTRSTPVRCINPLNPELNPIYYLLALLGAQHFLHVSRIRVKSLTLRLLTSYIYMEHPFLMFLDHTQRRNTVGRTPLDE